MIDDDHFDKTVSYIGYPMGTYRGTCFLQAFACPPWSLSGSHHLMMSHNSNKLFFLHGILVINPVILARSIV